MSGVNVHFLFLARPKEVIVCSGQRRESYRSLPITCENNQRFSYPVFLQIMGVVPVKSTTNLGPRFLKVCAHLGSRPKLEAGVYGRVGRLRQPQILDIIWGKAKSDPDGLYGPVYEVPHHRLEHGQ